MKIVKVLEARRGIGRIAGWMIDLFPYWKLENFEYTESEFVQTNLMGHCTDPNHNKFWLEKQQKYDCQYYPS